MHREQTVTRAELLTRVGALPVESRAAWLASLTPAELSYLASALAEGRKAPWREIARPDQLPPDGRWTIWLIMAGRGFGKTLTGANWAADQLRTVRRCRLALVAPTFADARDTMVEGETGLLSVLEPDELRGGAIDSAWNRSLGELYLANGTRAKCFSAEQPDRLRGPQHHAAWVDEPAEMSDADLYGVEGRVTTWDNLMLGLRLGDDPRVVVTGTPKPVALLKGRTVTDDTGGEQVVPGLPDLDECVVTTGSTYDNLENLAPTFRQQILARYEGTRIGAQELEGRLLTDVVGALWQINWIRRTNDPPPTFERAVVGIDPAVTATDASDETGIAAAGIDDSGNTWVLEDRSGRYTADGWATTAVELAQRWGARLLVETNQGGDMVVDAIRRTSRQVRITRVTAGTSKEARATPVAQLYERAHGLTTGPVVVHLPGLSVLEDQMTTWVPGHGRSPDRVDALVWALSDLNHINRRRGLRSR
jgi:phage terminase large subunit-like protein